MANSASSAGVWVEELFRNMAYQPDDSIATRALETGLSRDLEASINGRPITKATFQQTVTDARAAGRMVLENTRELLATPDDADKDPQTVAHIQTFSLQLNGSREKQRNTSLTICTVALENGERKLIKMTEIVTGAHEDEPAAEC